MVSQHFYPEMISTGHILTELLVELARNAASVSVVCGQPAYYSRERVPRHMTYENIDIFRSRNTQFDKNSVKGKLFNSATFFLHAMWMAAMEKKSGPVLLVTNPPFLGLIGPVIKALKRRPFILIIHDLYPDIAVEMGYMKESSPAVAFWKGINNWIFRRASFIVTLGRDMQRRLKEKLPDGEREKVVAIPNWADPNLISPIDPLENPFIGELGLEGKFIVQYSGNMGLSHDMDTIVEAARALREDREVQFLMIGGGGKRKEIQKKAAAYGLGNMTFLPYQPRENLRRSLGASHVSLISLEREAAGLSVPSKLYGIMASGRPVIAIVPEESEVSLTIKTFQCGIVISPHDVTGLVAAIFTLRENERERTEMGRRGYKAFLEHFTVEKCAVQYQDLLNRLETD